MVQMVQVVQRITISQILISLSMILILFSIIYPFVLFSMGMECDSKMDGEPNSTVIYHCSTPQINHAMMGNGTINPQHPILFDEKYSESYYFSKEYWKETYQAELESKRRFVPQTTLDGDIGTSDTTVSVTTATGLEESQTILVGEYILVEDEQMYINAISTNDLSVVRGANGTTAAFHVKGMNVSAGIYPDYNALIAYNHTLNPEWVEASESYRSFIRTSFNGYGLFSTILVLVIYELLLIGSVIAILTGNALTQSGLWRLFSAIGMIFVVFLLTALILVIPLRELISLAPDYVFLTLMWVPAVVGLGIYLCFIYRYQKRTTALENLHTVLDSNLSEIFSGIIPVDTQRTQSLGSRQLNLAQSILSSGFPQVFKMDRHIQEGELHLHQVEEDAVQEINKQINETTSIIREDIKSSFGMTHLGNDQVNQVFRYLLRDEEFKIFNEHLS